jgi:hypothetical protein
MPTEELARVLDDGSEEAEITQEAHAILTRARAVQVTTQAEYETAGLLYRTLRTLEKRIREYWKPIKKAQDDAKKLVLGRENEMLQPIITAAGLISPMLSSYDAKQRHAQQIAEARAVQEAKETGVPVPAVVQGSKPEGISFSSRWVVDVDDLRKFLTWVVETQQWGMVEVKQGEVDRYATKAKGQVSIPGCTVSESRIASGKSL